MRSLRHKHIVRYLGTERTESTFSIFMEYISGGSISRWGAAVLPLSAPATDAMTHEPPPSPSFPAAALRRDLGCWTKAWCAYTRARS